MPKKQCCQALTAHDFKSLITFQCSIFQVCCIGLVILAKIYINSFYSVTSVDLPRLLLENKKMIDEGVFTQLKLGLEQKLVGAEQLALNINNTLNIISNVQDYYKVVHNLINRFAI